MLGVITDRTRSQVRQSILTVALTSFVALAGASGAAYYNAELERRSNWALFDEEVDRNAKLRLPATEEWLSSDKQVLNEYRSRAAKVTPALLARVLKNHAMLKAACASIPNDIANRKGTVAGYLAGGEMAKRYSDSVVSLLSVEDKQWSIVCNAVEHHRELSLKEREQLVIVGRELITQLSAMAASLRYLQTSMAEMQRSTEQTYKIAARRGQEILWRQLGALGGLCVAVMGVLFIVAYSFKEEREPKSTFTAFE